MIWHPGFSRLAFLIFSINNTLNIPPCHRTLLSDCMTAWQADCEEGNLSIGRCKIGSVVHQIFQGAEKLITICHDAARLTGDVILDEHYLYMPSRYALMEPVLVDTAGYSIIVTGEVEFWGVSKLTFLGQSKEKGFFYVEKGGLLALNGVTVVSVTMWSDEETGLSLWQEEGSCLMVEDDCTVSGGVHYADSPYILYKNAV